MRRCHAVPRKADVRWFRRFAKRCGALRQNRSYGRDTRHKPGRKPLFLYRKLGIEDAAAWLALRHEGAAVAPSGFLVTEAESRAMTVETASKVLAYGGLRGVFDEDVLIGFCGYRPQSMERTRHRAELGPFYVTPDFQGTGAAQAMMRGVLEEAKEGGVEQIELSVAPANARAIAFYERHCYVQFGVLPDAIRENGASEDALLYRLQLG